MSAGLLQLASRQALPGPLKKKKKDALVEMLIRMTVDYTYAAAVSYPVRPYQIMDCGMAQIFFEPESFQRRRKIKQDHWKPSGHFKSVVQHKNRCFRCTNGNVVTHDKTTRSRYQKYIEVDAGGKPFGPSLYHMYKANPAYKPAPKSHKGALVLAGRLDDVNNPLLTLSHNSTSCAEFVNFSMNGIACGSISSTDSGGIVMASSTGDFAEWHEFVSSSGAQRETLPEGSVVGFYEGKISLNTTDAKIMGVVSARPIVLGSASRTGAGASVAYCGRVPVRVCGLVVAGDVLVPSGRNDGTTRVLTKDALEHAWGSCMGASCSAVISATPEFGGGNAVAVAMVSSAQVDEVLVHASITPPAMTKEVVQQLRGKTYSQQKRGGACATILAALLCTVFVLTGGRPPMLAQTSVGRAVPFESTPPQNASPAHQNSPHVPLASARLVRTLPTFTPLPSTARPSLSSSMAMAQFRFAAKRGHGSVSFRNRGVYLIAASKALVANLTQTPTANFAMAPTTHVGDNQKGSHPVVSATSMNPTGLPMGGGPEGGRGARPEGEYSGDCSHGTAVAKEMRTADDECDSCNAGYHFNGTDTANLVACAPWGGACKDGQLADQEDRTMQNQCGSCDDGFLIETDNFDDTIAPVCSALQVATPSPTTATTTTPTSYTATTTTPTVEQTLAPTALPTAVPTEVPTVVPTAPPVSAAPTVKQTQSCPYEGQKFYQYATWCPALCSGYQLSLCSDLERNSKGACQCPRGYIFDDNPKKMKCMKCPVVIGVGNCQAQVCTKVDPQSCSKTPSRRDCTCHGGYGRRYGQRRQTSSSPPWTYKCVDPVQ